MPKKPKKQAIVVEESFATDDSNQMDRYLDDSTNDQRQQDDDDVPRVVALTNIDSAILSDDEYTTLFVNVVRSIIQPSPWREIDGDDRIAMLRRARDVFVDCNDQFEPKLLKRIVRRVGRENSNSSLRNQYLAFMKSDAAWKEDKHREIDNWITYDDHVKFRDNCFLKVEHRLRMINQSASKDFAAKNSTWKMWSEISTGAAMRKPLDATDLTATMYQTESFSNQSGTIVNPSITKETTTSTEPHSNEPGLDDLFNSSKKNSCFGNVLSVSVHDAVWRPSNLSSAIAHDASKKAKSLPDELYFSVEIVIGGISQNHELDFKGRATRTDADPRIKEDLRDIAPDLKLQRAKKTNNAEEPVEITLQPQTGDERYWTFAEMAPILGVFLGNANIPPTSVEIHVHVRKANFSCFFSFTTLATIVIPATDLYHEILPIGSIGRERLPNGGFHLVHKHFVDSTTGFGLTLTLELKCLSKSHCEPPLFFDPDHPDTGIDRATSKARVPRVDAVAIDDDMKLWDDMWQIDHHGALMQLFDMFGSVNDLEFMILEAYCDRYLLDQELFDVAAFAATAKHSPFDNADERLDAVNATQALVKLYDGMKTRTCKEFTEVALEEIKDHVVNIMTCLEHFVPDPMQATHALNDAMQMLAGCGHNPKEFSDLIQKKIKHDIEDAVTIYSSSRKRRTNDQRVKALFQVAQKVFGEVQQSLEYAEMASQDGSSSQRVLALTLRRVDVMLQTLVPSLEQFVLEIMRVSSQDDAGQNEQDPLGETFCILSTLYGKAIECADFIGQYNVLEKLAASLSGVFDSFLTTWLMLSEKRTIQWIKLTVDSNPLKRSSSSRAFANQAPCDALHLINELFEFFGHCGECCPEDVILASTPLFCKLINKAAAAFSERLVEKGRALAIGKTKTDDELIEQLFSVFEAKLVCVSSLKQFHGLMDKFWTQRVFPELVEPLSGEGRQELLGNAMALRAECRASIEELMFTFSETHVMRDFVKENLRRVVFAPWEGFCSETKDRRVAEATVPDAEAQAHKTIETQVLPVYEKFLRIFLHNVDLTYAAKDLVKPLLRAMEDSYCLAVIGPLMVAPTGRSSANGAVLQYQQWMSASVLEGTESMASSVILPAIPSVDIAPFVSKCRRIFFLSRQPTETHCDSLQADMERNTGTRSSGILGRSGGTTSDWIVAILKSRADLGDKEALAFVKHHKL